MACCGWGRGFIQNAAPFKMPIVIRSLFFIVFHPSSKNTFHAFPIQYYTLIKQLEPSQDFSLPEK